MYQREDPTFTKAVILSHNVYDLLASFPNEERFGICTQLRRAVLSIPANLTEGYARMKPKVFLNHLEIAYGSLQEVKFFLYFSCQRHFISTNQYMTCYTIADEVGALLWKSIEGMQKKINH